MPSAPLVPHLSSVELEQNYIHSTHTTERVRWYMLWQRSLGVSIRDIMLDTGYSRSVVSTLIRKYNISGIDAVRDGRRDNGAASKLTLEQYQEMYQVIKTDSLQDRIWRADNLQTWLLDKYGIYVTLPCAWRYLSNIAVYIQLDQENANSINEIPPMT